MRALPRSKVALASLWILWAGILVQQLAVHTWRNAWTNDNPEFNRWVYAGVIGILLACGALRWVAMPRFRGTVVTVVAWLAGLIFSAMFTMTTSFLDMPWRDSTFVLGIVVIAGFIPVGTRAAAPDEVQP
jgi:hypothetical protein